VVVENARRKVLKVAPDFKKGLFIGADTLVQLKNKTIGKPKNKAQARELLKSFSSKQIYVFTGIYVFDAARKIAAFGFEKSSLFVKQIKPKEIDGYLDALGPYDKAGGFSIEGTGSLLFDDIRGSYFNILGLPMAKLQELLQRIDMNLLDFTQ